MKIKKINEDKVQIIITNQDLEERDFKKWEIIPINPKAQELFQDLLDMAYQECGFEIEDDSQLVVEAYPVSVDSFAIVMTKVKGSNLADHFNISAALQDEREEIVVERKENQVWGFPDLETCCRVCSRIVPDYIEQSQLYKCQEAYYLAIEVVPEALAEVNAIMGEYGEWIPFDISYLKEYGLAIINREAVVNLASMIS